eukprot:Phypoly_transcript_23627.p1 GENE.Phypoly_transcript_23627~~Phypoly_transcript_23627.p1  ORF type:complete len:173 (-),score=32.78 Phypoly_transcript_23627:23-541(-)
MATNEKVENNVEEKVADNKRKAEDSAVVEEGKDKGEKAAKTENKKTYHGSCHCGTVKFEAQADLETKGIGKCNCSICHKTNIVCAGVDVPSFKVLSGKDNLQDYQFGGKNFHHWFCKTCGNRPYLSGSMGGAEMIFVNTCCLDDFDPKGLTLTTIDGKNDTFAVIKTETLSA